MSSNPQQNDTTFHMFSRISKSISSMTQVTSTGQIFASKNLSTSLKDSTDIKIKESIHNNESIISLPVESVSSEIISSPQNNKNKNDFQQKDDENTSHDQNHQNLCLVDTQIVTLPPETNSSSMIVNLSKQSTINNASINDTPLNDTLLNDTCSNRTLSIDSSSNDTCSNHASSNHTSSNDISSNDSYLNDMSSNDISSNIISSNDGSSNNVSSDPINTIKVSDKIANNTNVSRTLSLCENVINVSIASVDLDTSLGRMSSDTTTPSLSHSISSSRSPSEILPDILSIKPFIELPSVEVVSHHESMVDSVVTMSKIQTNDESNSLNSSVKTLSQVSRFATQKRKDNIIGYKLSSQGRFHTAPRPTTSRTRQNLDEIDLLDLSGLYGVSGMLHHDGPYDACLSYRNQSTSHPRRSLMVATSRESYVEMERREWTSDLKPIHQNSIWGTNYGEAWEDYGNRKSYYKRASQNSSRQSSRQPSPDSSPNLESAQNRPGRPSPLSQSTTAEHHHHQQHQQHRPTEIKRSMSMLKRLSLRTRRQNVHSLDESHTSIMDPIENSNEEISTPKPVRKSSGMFRKLTFRLSRKQSKTDIS